MRCPSLQEAWAMQFYRFQHGQMLAVASSLVVCVAQFLDDLCQLAMCAAGVHNGRTLVLGCSRVPRGTNASLRKHTSMWRHTQLVTHGAIELYPQLLQQHVHRCSSSCNSSACYVTSSTSYPKSTAAVCCCLQCVAPALVVAIQRPGARAAPVAACSACSGTTAPRYTRRRATLTLSNCRTCCCL